MAALKDGRLLLVLLPVLLLWAEHVWVEDQPGHDELPVRDPSEVHWQEMPFTQNNVNLQVE